jgi:hypothetical protein
MDLRPDVALSGSQLEFADMDVVTGCGQQGFEYKGRLPPFPNPKGALRKSGR